MTKKKIIERYWKYRNRKTSINYNTAKEIENDFRDIKKYEWKPLVIKYFCPFCEKEIESDTECEHCGAKVIEQDGGNYCPACESTYSFTNNEEDIKELNKIKEDD